MVGSRSSLITQIRRDLIVLQQLLFHYEGGDSLRFLTAGGLVYAIRCTFMVGKFSCLLDAAA